jgi:Ser/Thr protein kinase RdoA (MazF antagonist)
LADGRALDRDVRAGEEPLAGGNVADAVVRVGVTVRKPWTASTPAVHAFLRYLADAGFAAAPRVIAGDGSGGAARDGAGRQVLEYVPGELAMLMAPMTVAELRRLGALVRSLHDLSAGFVPPADARWTVAIAADGADLICHQDLAPWNLIRDGDRWVFIDWDAAAPGTRLWDLAYVAQTFAPLLAGGDPAADGPRLAAVADGYGLGAEGRAALPAVLTARTRAMYDLLERASRSGEQPWARLWDEGHGVHWGGAADYVAAHEIVWEQALTL